MVVKKMLSLGGPALKKLFNDTGLLTLLGKVRDVCTSVGRYSGLGKPLF